MKVIILGGGASGLMAALSAARDARNTVTILERQSRVGRKLLATGNGRCNLTNLQLSPARYHGQDPAFAQAALTRFGVQDTLEFFRGLGLLTVAEDSGRVYPLSDQANSVLDVLRFAAEQADVQTVCGFDAQSVRKKARGYQLTAADGTGFFADRLIIACGGCAKAGKCVFGGTVNEFAEKAKEADGFVFGTPVHYAAASGNMTAFLDRLFYSAPKETFCRKPAAVVTSARRAGTTAAYEQLLKYPGIMEMPIVSSCYWNNVHGSCPEDVQKDEEGLRTMRVLGRNMAWLLRCIAAGTAAGVPAPRQEPLARTNFIR